jgi:sulfite reductase alpha subunit-like flavoprotein
VRVSRARYLTSGGAASDRRVVHVELDVSGSVLEGAWSPGDAIGVVVPNPADAVAGLCRRLRLQPDARIAITAAAAAGSSSGTPTPTPTLPSPTPAAAASCAPPSSSSTLVPTWLSALHGPGWAPTVADVLTWAVDVTSPPKKALARLLAEHAADPAERDGLMFLASRAPRAAEAWGALVDGQRLSLLDLLGLFPSVAPPLPALLSALPSPLPPRYYSLSCSPLADPRTMSFAFTVVQYELMAAAAAAEAAAPPPQVAAATAAAAAAADEAAAAVVLSPNPTLSPVAAAAGGGSTTAPAAGEGAAVSRGSSSTTPPLVRRGVATTWLEALCGPLLAQSAAPTGDGTPVEVAASAVVPTPQAPLPSPPDAAARTTAAAAVVPAAALPPHSHAPEAAVVSGTAAPVVVVAQQQNGGGGATVSVDVFVPPSAAAAAAAAASNGALGAPPASPNAGLPSPSEAAAAARAAAAPYSPLEAAQRLLRAEEDRAAIAHRDRGVSVVVGSPVVVATPQQQQQQHPAAVAPTSAAPPPPVVLRVFLRPTRDFLLPSATETPLILVGPGTGVAPFRGFMAHRRGRMARDAAAAVAVCRGWWRPGCHFGGGTASLREDPEFHVPLALGPAHLFFGNRCEGVDFLYRSDWEDALACGALTKLHTAWSRPWLAAGGGGAPPPPEGGPGGKTYVQHRLAEEGPTLARLLLVEGAHVYVCGDGARMAKDVHAALVAALVAHGPAVAAQQQAAAAAAEACGVTAAAAATTGDASPVAAGSSDSSAPSSTGSGHPTAVAVPLIATEAAAQEFLAGLAGRGRYVRDIWS